MYTDRSKSLDTEGPVLVFLERSERTTDHLAIYTVELMAIIAVLYWTEESGLKKVVICVYKVFFILFYFIESENVILYV